MTLKRLFIITGDASGDLHGSYLVKRLKETLPHLKIEAVGGSKIEAAGISLFNNQQNLGIFGLGFIGAIPFHYALGKKILNHFKTCKPDAVLLIDYGMFNLWMARQLKNEGIKVLYYVPPQVWASRRGRLKVIKKFIDHVFCIFPFEKTIYDTYGIPATFVGHPLLEQLPPPPDRKLFCKQHQLDADLPIIGIFPGSRKSEIKSLLKDMIKAVPLIQKESTQTLQFLLAKSPAISEDFFNKEFEPLKNIVKNYSFRILTSQNYEIMALSQAAIVASGTVTLEAALYNTPVVISYRVSQLAYHIFKHFVYVRHIGLPNLLAGKKDGFLPELLMDKLTPEGLARAIKPYLSNTPQKEEAQYHFKNIQQALGNNSASLNVVKALSSLMDEPLGQNPY